jgi:hypothetical protein
MVGNMQKRREDIAAASAGKKEMRVRRNLKRRRSKAKMV